MTKIRSRQDGHLWIVQFHDDPEMQEVRKKFGAQHLEFLDEHQDIVLLAGGLRYQPDTPFTGGMWIVRANSVTDIEKLIAADPYYSPRHRHFDIQYWGLAIDRMKDVFAASSN